MAGMETWAWRGRGHCNAPFSMPQFPIYTLHKTASPERKAGVDCPSQRLGLHLTPPKVQPPIRKISLSHCPPPQHCAVLTQTRLCHPSGTAVGMCQLGRGTRGQHFPPLHANHIQGQREAGGTDPADSTKQAKSHPSPSLQPSLINLVSAHK